MPAICLMLTHLPWPEHARGHAAVSGERGGGGGGGRAVAKARSWLWLAGDGTGAARDGQPDVWPEKRPLATHCARTLRPGSPGSSGTRQWSGRTRRRWSTPQARAWCRPRWARPPTRAQTGKRLRPSASRNEGRGWVRAPLPTLSACDAGIDTHALSNRRPCTRRHRRRSPIRRSTRTAASRRDGDDEEGRASDAALNERAAMALRSASRSREQHCPKCAISMVGFAASRGAQHVGLSDTSG